VKRILLIIFQVLMALLLFGLTAYSYVQLEGSDKVPFALWMARIRLVAEFLAGILFTVFALRNLKLLLAKTDGGVDSP
jgi:hypothetical protein